jgi:hypothetical protein
VSAFDDPVDWLCFADGRVVGSGAGEAPPELAAHCRRVELPAGAVAVPVLHDAHVHLLGAGLLSLGVDLSSVADIEETLDVVRGAARGHDGPLLRAHSLDPDSLSDRRYPTMAELDAATGSAAVFVRRRDGHSSAVSRAAFELIGLAPTDDGVELGPDGGPTGVLRGEAHSRAAALSNELLTRDEQVRALHLGARTALQAGAGVVHALVGRQDPDDREIELVLEVMDGLPIDVVVYPQTTDVDRVASLGLPRIGGCILLDGSFGSRTAALRRPYADAEGDGRLYFGDDELISFIRKAHRRGMQVSLHAIGDRAIDQAVRCLRAGAGSEASDARHRIEHCELPSPQAMADIARLGIGVCVQPAFERFWGGPGGLYERRLGRERMMRTNPYRAMLDAGVRLGGGSDAYVTPIDPLGGMAAAVGLPNAPHRVTAGEGLELFTGGAARLAFDEHRVGSLAPGSEASFTVLDGDPVEAGEEAYRLGVVDVYLRGEPVRPGPKRAS